MLSLHCIAFSPTCFSNVNLFKTLNRLTLRSVTCFWEREGGEEWRVRTLTKVPKADQAVCYSRCVAPGRSSLILFAEVSTWIGFGLIFPAAGIFLVVLKQSSTRACERSNGLASAGWGLDLTLTYCANLPWQSVKALVEVKLRSDRGEQIKPVLRVISIKYANQQTWSIWKLEQKFL